MLDWLQGIKQLTKDIKESNAKLQLAITSI